jgi:chemotaxis protein CheX
MVSTEEILSITENVFSTMIGSQVELVEKNEHAPKHDIIAGCVQISGEWKGSVMVLAPVALASDAASKMLAVPLDDVQIADCQDTVAELTNMIGGNIKSLVPGPSSLSLPSVTTGSEFDIRIFGTVTQNSVFMECDGRPFQVVLCESIV